jgi:iron(III) transport system substrate-binding protein
MITRRTFAATGLAAAMLPHAASAQDADWAKVVEAGKKEGRVVVYNAALGAQYYKDAVTSFEKAYGIKVETLDVRASELTERIRTEQAAGRYLADLEQHGAATILTQSRQGLIQPHGGVPNAKNLRPEFVPDELRMPGYVQAYAMLINTSMVKPEDEPKSLKDLTDPKWKGKILTDDYRASGGGNVFFFATYQKLGEDFHKALATQSVVFSRDIVNDTRRVARGEYPIYIPLRMADASTLKGLPVKMVVPAEGCPFIRIDFAMLKNAPNPNAARVFMNHFLEVETQIPYANAGQIPVVKGVVEKIAPEMQIIAGAKLLGTTNPDDQDMITAKAKELYK